MPRTRPNSTPDSRLRLNLSLLSPLTLSRRAGLEALPLGYAEPCTHLDGIGNSNRHHLPGAEGKAQRPGHPRAHAQRIDHRLRIRGRIKWGHVPSMYVKT